MDARDLSSLFGVTVENVKRQLLANASALEGMADKAKASEDGTYRGRTEATWRESATDYRRRAGA